MIWRDIRDGLRGWRSEGTPFALATVVRAHGSAPRPVGTAMAVTADGRVLGSVSGGCVEADVFERALAVIASGRAELVRYGVGDGEAFAVGLSCGGELEVFLEPVDDRHFPEVDRVLDRLDRDLPTALATWLDGSDAPAHLVVEDDATAVVDAHGHVRRRLQRLLGGSTAQMLETCAPDGTVAEEPVFVQSSAPPPRMILFGAVDVAAALAQVGSFLGYRVTVCDARPVFTTPERFPHAHEVVVERPHRYLASQRVEESTVVCVLTHHPDVDVPLLQVALESPAAYVGAMGSRRTHDDRVRRLLAAGVAPTALARLRSPLGLDLGARTAQETALSIAAEVLAMTSGRSGLPLRDLDVPIHGALDEPLAGRRRA